MKENPKFAFIGDSHMAFWALNIYFPLWECLDYGVPNGKGYSLLTETLKQVYNQ